MPAPSPAGPPGRYHHGDLRRALVEAAVEAAREHGPAGVALRDLARTVGVSHNAAYRHFTDRDALLGEVAGRGMGELATAIESRLAQVVDDDPVTRARRRLYATGRAYVGFALAQPGLFRVAFTSYSQVPASPADPGSHPYVLLTGCLDDLVDVGWLAPAARPDAELSCWSAVHGFATLCLEGPLRELPEDARELALTRMLQLVDRSAAASSGRVCELGRLGGAEA